jgi:hypothetical protein
MKTREEPGDRRWIAFVALALIVVGSAPYLVAWLARPTGMYFTGLLFNPLDGNSYIAKMRQGLNGSWLFHLPYTPEPQQGAPIFLFHLGLGHLARLTGAPLIIIYHGARLIGGVVILLAIHKLVARFGAGVRQRRFMTLLALLGAGFGWLAGPLGRMTADLWVPEAFPSYAVLTNAHFPISIGLMCGIALCGLGVLEDEDGAWRFGLGLVLSAVALGVVQPFGLAPIFGGLGAMLLQRSGQEQRVPWRAILWIGAAAALAALYPLYMQWSIRSDPVLAAWSAQNVTPSPPLWDWALSYGLVALLAVPGAVWAARRGRAVDGLLLGWAGTTLVGMYVPLALQRRLSLGLGVPLGLLAGAGWWHTLRPRVRPRFRRLARAMLLGLVSLTLVFLLVAATLTAVSGGPRFYLRADEWEALVWLRDQPRGVVLCAPEMGAFVPAWAGQPVVYGHPFETVNAAERRARVEAYWSGEMAAVERARFIEENYVHYVLVGPRERELAPPSSTMTAESPLFELGDVRVYEVE